MYGVIMWSLHSVFSLSPSRLNHAPSPSLVLPVPRSCRPWGSPTTLAVSAVSSVTSAWTGCPSPWTQRTRSIVSEITTSKEGQAPHAEAMLMDAQQSCQADTGWGVSACLQAACPVSPQSSKGLMGGGVYQGPRELSRCLCRQELIKESRFLGVGGNPDPIRQALRFQLCLTSETPDPAGLRPPCCAWPGPGTMTGVSRQFLPQVE